jgi:hypothetical protein
MHALQGTHVIISKGGKVEFTEAQFAERKSDIFFCSGFSVFKKKCWNSEANFAYKSLLSKSQEP